MLKTINICKVLGDDVRERCYGGNHWYSLWTLQAKFQTRDLQLSSGSNPCVLLGCCLLAPCDFHCLAGAGLTGIKITIWYLDNPTVFSGVIHQWWWQILLLSVCGFYPLSVSQPMELTTCWFIWHSIGDLIQSVAHSQPVEIWLVTTTSWYCAFDWSGTIPVTGLG